MDQLLNPIKGTGRRKTSVATVEMVPGNGDFTINQTPGVLYMQQNSSLIFTMQAPLEFLKVKNEYNVTVKVEGGGLVGQAEAIKLGVARALCEFNSAYRSSLKLKGYLTRDARIKERKKYGLKKARKAPQFSKR
uniref:Small ribosomal subunit protein uS9c n=1 Tax=Sykidion marinum TaxID=44573 RepID=A0A1W6EGK5_SYKMA|nr:ribosomal protein S9 [Pseudoneochloris marina]ARK14528.1 ribosomal protein S9 [Pseudoneochloris marina]